MVTNLVSLVTEIANQGASIPQANLFTDAFCAWAFAMVVFFFISSVGFLIDNDVIIAGSLVSALVCFLVLIVVGICSVVSSIPIYAEQSQYSDSVEALTYIKQLDIELSEIVEETEALGDKIERVCTYLDSEEYKGYIEEYDRENNHFTVTVRLPDTSASWSGYEFTLSNTEGTT